LLLLTAALAVVGGRDLAAAADGPVRGRRHGVSRSVQVADALRAVATGQCPNGPSPPGFSERPGQGCWSS
ncbi:hypothetical protein, partial [Streptomyces sp. yr375]|uniref:hypothetical protein n=1 Tax=Streptomyces sp. yr375 TaxID=1761906 RepID=UPI001C4351F5